MVKSMRILLLILFSTLLACIANADEDAVEKYRNYLPEEIAALSDEERRSEIPMMYTMAAQTGLGAGAELYFGIQLNKLMYPGVENTPEAIKSFQRDHGEAQTGTLTVGQIHRLNYLAELQSVGKIHFPTDYTHGEFNGFASVKGTVKILDERIAYPINRVEISCYKNGMYCEYEQLVLIMPNEDSWAQIPYLNKFDTEIYEINRWQDGQIDAVPANQSPSACRMNTLNLNFSTQEFFEITRNLKENCETILGEVPKLEKPRISQILDGSEIIDEEFASFTEKAYQAWSTDVRARIEGYNAQE